MDTSRLSSLLFDRKERLHSQQIMWLVALACLPGILAQLWFFGFGIISNLIFCCGFCVLCEALCDHFRKNDLGASVRDYSAILTGVLLAISLPPYLPFTVCAFASLFSIVIAKQLYGGLGCNPFNPAMTGYAACLISFPVPMTRWIMPGSSSEALSVADGTKQAILLDAIPDSVTGATPLEIVRENDSQLLEDLYSSTALFNEASLSTVGYEWVSIAFALGGGWMLYRGIIRWHAPISMLVAVLVTSALFYDGGSSTSGGSPLFHLLNGATIFGAFFIATDPVSGATSQRGRILFGALVGCLTVLIRVKGYYPEGIAFAILLGNFAVPIIDKYSRPRAFGTKLSSMNGPDPDSLKQSKTDIPEGKWRAQTKNEGKRS